MAVISNTWCRKLPLLSGRSSLLDRAGLVPNADVARGQVRPRIDSAQDSGIFRSCQGARVVAPHSLSTTERVAKFANQYRKNDQRTRETCYSSSPEVPIRRAVRMNARAYLTSTRGLGPEFSQSSRPPAGQRPCDPAFCPSLWTHAKRSRPPRTYIGSRCIAPPGTYQRRGLPCLPSDQMW